MKNYFKLSTLALALATTFTTPVFAEDRPEFISNGDGTVTHNPTGLIWQACAVGQTWDASFATCTGEAKKFKYSDEDNIGAIQLTSDFAGQKDWRLPTIAELNTIIDAKRTNPAINKSFFPNTPADYFWSTPFSGMQSDITRVVDFDVGSFSTYSKSNNAVVRLVHGTTVSSFTNLTDFVDNKDGTVTNNKTGLTWQRCAMGKTWNDGYCDGTAATYKQSDAAKLNSDLAGQTDWRLPTYKELQTIVDYGTQYPAINSTVFPDTPKTQFWTTTPKSEQADYFWYVNFDNGSSYYTSKASLYSARLVRGTLWGNSTTPVATGNVDLVSTLSANPSPAKMGGDLTYTATITNKGTAPATGAKVTFFVAPKFMTFKSSSANCDYSGGLSVICQIGDLAAGANVTKTMTVTLKKAGGISSSVSAKANEKDANPGDNVGKVATGVKK